MKPTFSVTDLERACGLSRQFWKEVRHELNKSRKRLDVKILCGSIMRNSETFKAMEYTKTDDQQWNRVVPGSFVMRAA